MQIEISSACTLRCALCPAGTGSVDDPHRNMTLDTFRSIMDDLGDHSIMAILWMWGEPFVNPKFPEMIDCAKRKTIATLTSTNGQHIQTQEDAERVVASGLDGLIVAIDGATQESYSRYRIGGDITKAFRCLEMLRKAKDALGIEKPCVNVRTVVMKQNEHELGQIEDIARRYGANMVSRKWVWISEGPDADPDFAPEAGKYKSYEYKDGQRVRLPLQKLRCKRPFDRIHISVDGTALSCEFDYGAKRPTGRPADGVSYLKAWWGQAAQQFRHEFSTRRDDTYPCNPHCGFRDRRHTLCNIEAKMLR